MDENINKLYQALLSKGYSEDYLGGFDTFSQNITDPEKNKSFYNKVISDQKISENELGSYEVFAEKTLGGVKKKGSFMSSLQKGIKKVGEALGVEGLGEPSTDQSPSQSNQFTDLGKAGDLLDEESPAQFSAPDIVMVDQYGKNPMEGVPQIDQDTAQRMLSNYSPKESIPDKVIKDIDAYYDEKGWMSPQQKYDQYNTKGSELIKRYEAGEIDAANAEAERQSLLDELNLISVNGSISVPETEVDMYKELYKQNFRKRMAEDKAQTKDPYLKDVLENLSIEADRALSMPWRVLGTAERIGNQITQITGLRDQGDEDTYFQNMNKLQNGWIEEMAALNERYDQSIGDAVADGNMVEATGQAIMKSIGAIPRMLPVILSAPSGAFKVGQAIMGADITTETYMRNAEDPSMNEFTRFTNAFSHGLSEYAFMSFATIPILKGVKGSLSQTSRDVIQKEAKEAFTPYFQRTLSKVFRGLGPGVREGIEEGMTGLSQDIADYAAGKPVKIGEHLFDDMSIGFLVGQGMASTSLVDSKGGAKEYVRSLRNAVPKDLVSTDQADLLDIYIESDELSLKLKNAPEAGKGAIKAKMENLNQRAEEILYRSDQFSDLAQAGDLLKQEATQTEGEPTVEAPERAVEPLSPESGTKSPSEGESAPDAPKRDGELRDVNFDLPYINTEDIPIRIKFLNQVQDYLNTKAESDFVEGGGKPMTPSVKGVFNTTNMDNQFGVEGAKIKDVKDIDRLKTEVADAISKTESELEARKDLPDTKEGEIRYGGRNYKNIEELKNEFRKSNVGLFPLDMDIDVMRAMEEVRVEQDVQRKKTQQDVTEKQSAEEVPVGDKPKVSEEAREADTETLKEDPTAKEGGLIPVGASPPAVPPTRPPTSPPMEGDGKPPSEDPLDWKKRAKKQESDYIKKQKERPTPNVITKVKEAVFDTKAAVRKQLRKLNSDEAARAERDLVLKHGASALAAMRLSRARARVFGDVLLPGKTDVLGSKSQKILEDAIQAQRVIEIEENRNKKRLAFVTEQVTEQVQKIADVKEGLAKEIQRIVDENVTVEEVYARLNEVIPDAISTEQLDAIWAQAEADFPSLKHEAGMTRDVAYRLLEDLENKRPELLAEYGLKLDDVDIALLRNRAESYYEVMRESLKLQYESGIINKELYDKLLTEYPYYSPRMYMEYVNMIDGQGGISGIQALAGGAEGPTVKSLDALMSDNIMRSSAAAFNNRLMNSLADLARSNPDNGIVKVAKVKEGATEQLELMTNEKGLAINDPALREAMDRNLDDVYDATPGDMVAVSYYENGQKKRMWMDAYIHGTLFPEQGDAAAKIDFALDLISWGVGVPILRAMATGYNPEFAFKNVFLDGFQQWMATSEYSAFLPKAMAQMREGMSTVMEDAVMRKGRFIEWIEEGGGMEFLSTQGKFEPSKLTKGYSNLKAGVKEAGDIMGYIGQTSEVVMRLALRERAINNRLSAFRSKNGRSPNESEMKEIQKDATAASRSYVDFNQGGYVAKSLNKVIPYLNAALQVARSASGKMWRNPLEFGVKVGQLAIMSAAITKWNMGDYDGGDEEEKEKMRQAYMNDISNQVKGANFVIMTPLKYQDDKGYDRYMYIRLPLNPFTHNITMLAEDMTIRHSLGGAYSDHKLLNTKQAEALKSTLRNFGDPSSLPPFHRAWVGYKSNYDDFYDEEIWTGAEYGKDKSQEYRSYTPERFVEIGRRTEMSPARLQYAAKQIFTGSNLFASAMGEALDHVALKANPELQQVQHKKLANELTNTPFVRRFVKTTSPYANIDAKEAQGKRNAMKSMHNKKVKEIMDSVLSEEDQSTAIYGLVDSVMANDFIEGKRIMNYYHYLTTSQDISNNMFSFLMVTSDPAVRADLHHEKTKGLNPDKRSHLDDVSMEIEGLWTDDFITRLDELRRRDSVEWE